MQTNLILAKTRDRQPLSADEIRHMIDGLVSGDVHDYQIAAWAMAITCRGLTPAETAHLTDIMLASGTRLQRRSERPRVDKHSTGGLGDKVSLILAPLLACFDVEVPMLSGRGLGLTGGTLDKLESYSGYRCDLSTREIDSQLDDIGCVITGTTPEIAPADRKLYGLRDVTGTVPSVALITASILCKKLAETLDALVLDVKFGSGTSMSTVEEARVLADSMRLTGAQLGLQPKVVLSNMNQPLGAMVGNACEVNEAVDVLRGEGPDDVIELIVRLAEDLLAACDRRPAEGIVRAKLNDGQAYERYRRMIAAQGGRYVDRLELAAGHPWLAEQSGYVASINGQSIGQTILELGGSRSTADRPLNHRVGLRMRCRVGDEVESGQPLIEIFADDQERLQAARRRLAGAICITPEPTAPLQLIWPDEASVSS